MCNHCTTLERMPTLIRFPDRAITLYAGAKPLPLTVALAWLGWDTQHRAKAASRFCSQPSVQPAYRGLSRGAETTCAFFS